MTKHHPRIQRRVNLTVARRFRRADDEPATAASSGGSCNAYVFVLFLRQTLASSQLKEIEKWTQRKLMRRASNDQKKRKAAGRVVRHWQLKDVRGRSEREGIS